MINKRDIDELGNKNICHDCIGDHYLSAEIESNGKTRKCSYCGEAAKGYSIKDMAKRIDGVFEEHYICTATESEHYSMLWGDDYWERQGEPAEYAIMNSANMPRDAAIDIQIILENKHNRFYSLSDLAMGEETPFDSGSCYEEIGASDARWQEEWSKFEQSIKTESRFFSNVSLEYLKSVFENINEMETRDNRPLIVNIGPNTDMPAIFRARVFQAGDKLKTALMRPDIHLSSPPSEFATAGRMNAHGISVFYGANDPAVAIAEVRPPVGSQVVTARFEVIRSLNLLDLTALELIKVEGSVFDPDYIHRLERARFLNTLSQKITRVVMPDDEVFEYLTTQAIADFLSNQSNPCIDGIIFPSAQATNTSTNVVLFYKASKIKNLNFPEGTELDVILSKTYEEGTYHEFSVTENVPSKEKSAKKIVKNQWGPDLFNIDESLECLASNSDCRKPALKIDTDNIVVHIIDSVQFISSDFKVNRSRREKKELNVLMF